MAAFFLEKRPCSAPDRYNVRLHGRLAAVYSTNTQQAVALQPGLLATAFPIGGLTPLEAIRHQARYQGLHA